MLNGELVLNADILTAGMAGAKSVGVRIWRLLSTYRIRKSPVILRDFHIEINALQTATFLLDLSQDGALSNSYSSLGTQPNGKSAGSSPFIVTEPVGTNNVS